MSSNYIYTIYRFTNTINQKVYIGMTYDFNRRINSHKHASKKEDTALYRAIRKYGWEYFSVDVIYQTKSHQHCIDMETHFILEYNNYNKGYNMTLGGEGSVGANTKQYEFYDIYGNHFTVTNLHKFCEENNLNSRCMYQLANNKMLKHDIYVSSKQSTKTFKKYKVFDTIKNEIIEINNLSEFCEEHNLDKYKMRRLVCNGRNVYKNYKNLNKLDYVNPDEKEYSFILNKHIIKIRNLKQYCIDNNLSFSCMRDVGNGKNKSYNDYININFPDFIPLHRRILKLISPDGDIIEINNIKRFCEENGISENSIQQLKSKKQKQHKGYRLYE